MPKVCRLRRAFGRLYRFITLKGRVLGFGGRAVTWPIDQIQQLAPAVRLGSLDGPITFNFNPGANTDIPKALEHVSKSAAAQGLEIGSACAALPVPGGPVRRQRLWFGPEATFSAESWQHGSDVRPEPGHRARGEQCGTRGSRAPWGR